MENNLEYIHSCQTIQIYIYIKHNNYSIFLRNNFFLFLIWSFLNEYKSLISFKHLVDKNLHNFNSKT